mgnify:CR=1 FL=1
MSENGQVVSQVSQDFDFEKAEERILELQRIKTSLSYENAQNKALNEELRRQVESVSRKIDELKDNKKQVILEIEAKVSESERMQEDLRQLRITKEIEQNDIDNQGKLIQQERDAFEFDKSSFKKNQEAREVFLSRKAVEIEEREKLSIHGIEEIEARLKEIENRERAIAQREFQAHSLVAESEQVKKEAEIASSESKKLMDEAKSQRSACDQAMKTLADDKEAFLLKESAFRDKERSFSEEKSNLETLKRDLTLEQNRLFSIRNRIKKEIENSQLEEELKNEFKAKLDEEPKS